GHRRAALPLPKRCRRQPSFAREHASGIELVRHRARPAVSYVAAVAFRTRSRVSGSCRTRAPHAAYTAFAIAAAVGTAPGSPTPVGGALASPSTSTSIDAGASLKVAMG